ncbi:hypothetical protein BT69DRAFT_1293038 [Atractiella rhizophila]|nr:hypothetical protein BT69DRAFT_1293038 [Atractiella rhizophila]
MGNKKANNFQVGCLQSFHKRCATKQTSAHCSLAYGVVVLETKFPELTQCEGHAMADHLFGESRHRQLERFRSGIRRREKRPKVEEATGNGDVTSGATTSIPQNQVSIPPVKAHERNKNQLLAVERIKKQGADSRTMTLQLQVATISFKGTVTSTSAKHVPLGNVEYATTVTHHQLPVEEVSMATDSMKKAGVGTFCFDSDCDPPVQANGSAHASPPLDPSNSTNLTQLTIAEDNFNLTGASERSHKCHEADHRKASDATTNPPRSSHATDVPVSLINIHHAPAGTTDIATEAAALAGMRESTVDGTPSGQMLL